MVGSRGRSSVGKGIRAVDMTLVYRLVYRRQSPNRIGARNANHLSVAGAGDPFSRAEPAIVCELPDVAGGGHRLGTRRRGPMGIARPWRTSPGSPENLSTSGQIQSPQMIATPPYNDTISGKSRNYAPLAPCQTPTCQGSLKTSHDGSLENQPLHERGLPCSLALPNGKETAWRTRSVWLLSIRF